MNLKRDLVKYVRDKAKSQYKKTSSCHICGSNTDLDFHHYYGLTELLETWIKQNKIIIKIFLLEIIKKKMKIHHKVYFYI